MGALQNRARSALNKLCFFVGDRKEAEDTLHKNFGTRDPLSLNDVQAKQFAESVFNAYGSFKARPSASDNDRERLVPSTDGSHKAKLDPVAIYKKFNARSAGVSIRKVEGDE